MTSSLEIHTKSHEIAKTDEEQSEIEHYFYKEKERESRHKRVKPGSQVKLADSIEVKKQNGILLFWSFCQKGIIDH